ncbi:MAG TPA: hypothetical protein VFO65_02175, partial [Acidimicrobiales bacterium]|nr:hypothetical protein [Acidimicrobiales bacterium]
GRLYAANTVGAALGAAVSGWYLLGEIGFVGTIRLAAAGNLAAAVVVALLARTVAPGAAGGRRSAGSPPEADVVDPARRPAVIFGDRAWPWFLVYGLTGAVALGLEVVFFRVIDAVMRSNSYTFAHVLSLYLLLFGLGGAVGARLVRRARRPDVWFLWLQWAAGAGALAGVLALLAPLKLPDVGGLRPFLEDYFRTDGLATGFALDRKRTVFVTLVAPLLVMALPVACFGAAFPFVQALAARRVDVLGRHTGRLLFANIVGNVTGTLATGFVLLDRLGSSGTLRLLGVMLVVPGVLAALHARTGARRVVLAGGAVAVAVALVAVFPSNRGLWALLHTAPVDGFVVQEERSCVDTLVKRDNDVDVLYVNGASQNGYPYDEFHVLIGLLPALLHPAPERGLAVGLGLGGTTYGLALDPRVTRVETVEICGGQVDLLEHLAARGDAPDTAELLVDERLSVVVGDGRKHLLGLNEGDLDLLVVDTLRPTAGYSGNLYSREFYELVASRLGEEGLFAQWLPSGRTLETMQETFPHLMLFDVPTYFGSRFAVASRSPVPFDREAVLDRLAATDLATLPAGLTQALQTFLATTVPAPLAGGRAVADDRRNEDLFPRDEYWLNNGY